MFFVQTSTLPQECTENLPKTWKALYAKQPTPDQNSLWDKRIALMTIPAKKKSKFELPIRGKKNSLGTRQKQKAWNP